MYKLKAPSSNRHIIELFYYICVSVIALLIDFSVYWLLVLYDVFPLPSAGVSGYITGLSFAYFFMAGKVFQNGWLEDKKHLEVLLFIISGLVGITLTYFSVLLYVYTYGENFFNAKLVATIISFVGVYLFRKLFVFKVVVIK